MVHPPSTSAIEVDLADVLWLTRGRHWDYRFLVTPRVGAGWLDLQWKLFRGIAPELRPQHVSGTMRGPGGTRAYLATVFLDPVRRDDRGRPVAHRIVWFPPGEQRARLVAPADWGPDFVAAMGPALDTVFNVVMYSASLQRTRGLFMRAAADLAQPVRLESTAVMVYAQSPIDTHFDLPAVGVPANPSRSFWRSFALSGATLAVLMVLAFLLGRWS